MMFVLTVMPKRCSVSYIDFFLNTVKMHESRNDTMNLLLVLKT